MASSLSSQSHHTHSVGLLWTSDRPDAKTSSWQHTTLKRDRQPCPIRDSNPQFQQSSGRGPTPRGHWDRLYILFQTFFFYKDFASNILFPLLLPVSRPGPLQTPCKNKRDFLYEYLWFLRINHLRCLICLIACIIISQKEREDHKPTESIKALITSNGTAAVSE